MPRNNQPRDHEARPQGPRPRGQEEALRLLPHDVGRVDYKDLAQLRKYISDRGKIRAPPGVGQLRSSTSAT